MRRSRCRRVVVSGRGKGPVPAAADPDHPPLRYFVAKHVADGLGRIIAADGYPLDLGQLLEELPDAAWRASLVQQGEQRVAQVRAPQVVGVQQVLDLLASFVDAPILRIRHRLSAGTVARTGGSGGTDGSGGANSS